MKTIINSFIRPGLCVVIFALGLLLQGCAHAPASETKVPRITKEELKSMLENPDMLILDVRSTNDWNESEWKIKGAIHEDRKGKSNVWMDKYPKDKVIVLYCA
jgi:hypothetical protein